MSEKVPQSFKNWFLAAAVYNAVWGIVVALFPAPIIAVAGLGGLISAPFLQVIAMMVGVYAYG